MSNATTGRLRFYIGRRRHVFSLHAEPSGITQAQRAQHDMRCWILEAEPRRSSDQSSL